MNKQKRNVTKMTKLSTFSHIYLYIDYICTQMYKYSFQEISEKLKNLRHKAQPNLSSFATKNQIGRSTLTKIESGKPRGLTLDTFFKILNGLNLRVEDVVPIENTNLPANDELDSMTKLAIESFQNLPLEARLMVLNLIQSLSNILPKSDH